jgi:putative transposase
MFHGHTPFGCCGIERQLRKLAKSRAGSYFPEWLLERRKRAEAALVSVVATCYLLGVPARRMDKLVQSLGITGLSRSQVSRMAADLDEQVAAFRTRPLGQSGPFTFVAADALTMKVRENGRVVSAVVLVATGVNADGHREVLGIKVATSETREAWNVFFADLTACGLTGVMLVTSDAHAGLVEAIAANLPGASWQRCRTHYAANLMSLCPKSAWPAVKTMLHPVYDQPDADAVHAQYDKLLDQVTARLPAVGEHLDAARADVLAFTAFPKELWRQVRSNNPIVIWSPRGAVLHVDHEGLRGRVLPGGRGYLRASIMRISRRNHACSAGAHARLVA